jgi:hypothetical protein
MPLIDVSMLASSAQLPDDNDLLESVGKKLFVKFNNTRQESAYANLLNEILEENKAHHSGLSYESLYKTTLGFMLAAKANGIEGIKIYEAGIEYLNSLDVYDISTLDNFTKELQTAKEILKATPYSVPAAIQDLELKNSIAKAYSYEDTKLADRLDAQYEIYKFSALLLEKISSEKNPEQLAIKNFQEKSKNFLEFVLDVKGENKIHERMAFRLAKQKNNPEYIPGNVSPKIMSKALSSTNKIRSLFIRGYQNEKLKNENKLLAVSDKAKAKDADENTQLLTSAERDNYRIIIHDGQFYQRKADNTFIEADTQKNIAKGKTGHASYVLNNKGELSIFDHKGGDSDFYHSSPNSQAYVMGAGDLKITNGQLVELSTDSGHYLPDIASAVLVLQYFQDHNVDVSKVIVGVHVYDSEQDKNVIKKFNALDIIQHLGEAKEIAAENNSEVSSWGADSNSNWDNFDNVSTLSVASDTESDNSISSTEDSFASDSSFEWSEVSSPKASESAQISAADDPFFDNNNDWGTFPAAKDETIKETEQDVGSVAFPIRPKR